MDDFHANPEARTAQGCRDANQLFKPPWAPGPPKMQTPGQCFRETTDGDPLALQVFLIFNVHLITWDSCEHVVSDWSGMRWG